MPRTFVIPRQLLPYIAGRKLHAMKLRDGFENKTWADYFVYIANKGGISITETSYTTIQYGTGLLLPMWLSNFSENLPYIKHGDNTAISYADNTEGHTIAELATPEKDIPEHSAIVIGRGPSIFQHKHLEVLADAKKNSKYTGLVIATDGMLIDCLKRDIVPDLVVSVDGSPIIEQWFADDLVKKHGDQLKVALPASINNSVYRRCVANGCHVYWYTPMFDDFSSNESLTKLMRALTKTPNNPNGLVMVGLGGNAGAASWVMAARVLKCSPVCLIGIDFGYPEGTNLEHTPYFSGMIQNPGQIKSAYTEVYHSFFKTKAYADIVFQHYKRAFLDLQTQVPPWFHQHGGTINCTEGGTLFGPLIRNMYFKDFLEKYDT